MTSISQDIKKIFDEDQDDRRSSRYHKLSDIKRLKIIQARDQKRGKKMAAIIAERPKLKGIDCFRAGIVFQHGGTVASTRKARDMAKKGAELGHERSKWLYAAATDRILVMQGKRQKFGTQYRKNGQGIWELSPVDQKTTDAERRKYHVKPLQKASEMVSYLNRVRRPRSKKIGLTRR